MSYDIVDIDAQLEQELKWRIDEIRFFKNLMASMDEKDSERYRKALVTSIYAHYEGFCKEAFSIFIKAVNSEDLEVSEVQEYLATASMSDIFKEYEVVHRKNKYFHRILPDDTQLHRYCRQVDFIVNIQAFMGGKVSIPMELADTESNLTASVLKKIMYRLGFDVSFVDGYVGKITRLVKSRNEVAHGQWVAGVKAYEYDEYEQTCFDIMNGVKYIIFECLNKKSYLKCNSCQTTAPVNL